jgi:hypothetical protein
MGPSLMVPTAFTFRITGNDGTTLRDLVYSQKEQPATISEPQPELTVALPPGAAASGRLNGRPENDICVPTRPTPFRLQSWTDSALANYSGTALYETTFDLPRMTAGEKLFLDLGAVGVAAEVWINGRYLAQRAWRPFRFEIGTAVHPGTNQLRIRVANSDAGWQSQGDSIYPKGSWGLHYQTERDRITTIRPNGLEGPVRILIER